MYGGDWLYTGMYFGLVLLACYLMFRLLRRRLRYAESYKARLVAYLVIGLVPFIPYLAVVFETNVFGASLRPYVLSSMLACGGMCGNAGSPIERYRVLKITPWTASVYIVQPCVDMRGMKGNSATVINMRKGVHGWTFVDYSVPWSDCGTAKGNVFPPYPEGKEF